jgi:hypothetical protein
MATAPAPTVWSVVRDILSTNLLLSADEVITKAKAKGAKAPDDVIRTTVYNVRKKLKQKATQPAKVVPAAARQTTNPTTTGPTVSSVVRAILSADLELSADEVVAQAKARGLTASDTTIRSLVYNIRGELKKAAPKPMLPPAAVKSAPKAAPSQPKSAPAAIVVPLPSPSVAGVLSNVALVNAAVAGSGGVEKARQVAEAVRACGGPDQFAQYLDLVAGIRTA